MQFNAEELKVLKGILLVEVADLKDLIKLPNQTEEDVAELEKTLKVVEGMLAKID